MNYVPTTEYMRDFYEKFNGWLEDGLGDVDEAESKAVAEFDAWVERVKRESWEDGYTFGVTFRSDLTGPERRQKIAETVNRSIK